MSIIISKAVDFGSRKNGLSTVGYVLKNPDGTVKAARTTSGVVNIVAGIYSAEISFDDGWSGLIVWDTGEGTPLYAVENFDHRAYGGAAGFGVIGGGGGDIVWTSKEKNLVLERLRKIFDIIKKFDQDKIIGIIKAVESVNQKKFADIIVRVEKLRENNDDQAIEALRKDISQVAEAMAAILEIKELEMTINKEDIENVFN